ncbi:MAG: FHA domain-containing protein [Butyrivibrio sp.]|nr:FHA domain-containing protein [Butyrivibrio sp.]
MFDSSGLVFVLVAVLILLIVGGVTAFLVIFLRRNKRNSVGGSASAVINGLSGTMKGKSYQIRDLVTMGRNREVCQICYPVNTHGISGVHCQIQRQGNSYVIIDKGSSYGTFVGDGEKLAPNVPRPIASGEFFYLADREQLFQIRY